MKTKNFLHKNLIYILSALIPILLMLIIFIVREIYPFGDESFLHIDMYHQYFPFLTEFYHKVKNGESLFYSFKTGIGSNFLALYVYYLASPFNWLSLLVPENLLIEFMTYFVVLKIGACGFTFSYYLKKHFHSDSFCIVFFSVFYALSGYMAAYNWDVMWIDCIVLAPLIILGLERLVNEGRCKLYCITLALAILSNYYICIMICIYLVLYFFVLLISAEQKGKACLRFAWYSLLAGGMAAILLLPELNALFFTEFSNSNFPKKMTSYFSILDMLARHSMNVPVETGLDHWPNLYCGVAVFFLLPLYVLKKEVPLKEKLPKLFLLFFLLLSFSTNTLNFIWHGMNYPDSLPCRQSFLYIILLLTVCFEALSGIENYSRKTLGACAFGILCFLLLCQQLADAENFTYSVFLTTLFMLLAYCILIFYYHYSMHPENGVLSKPVKKQLILYTALALCMLEAGLNTYITSVPTVNRSNYLKSYDDYYTLMDRLSTENQGFYRVEKFRRVTKNDGMLLSYPSASLFSSTSNAHVKDFYGKYGMQNSKVYYNYDGATPLTAALLNVTYMISRDEKEPNSLYRLVDREGDLYLYENTYSLPFGFFVDTETAGKSDNTILALEKLFGSIEDLEAQIKDETEDEVAEEALSPLTIQNRLAMALSVSDTLFEAISSEKVSDKKIKITAEKDGYIYCFTDSSKINKITASFPKEGEQESLEFTKLKNEYIMDLGYHHANDVITLETKDDASFYVSAYIMNENALAECISKLSEQSLILDSYDSTHIKGHISINKSGNLVLSIPYEPGWTLKVNGTVTEMNIFEDTFVSIPLTVGEYDIELSYYPAGFNAGIAGSVLSLAAFLVTLYLKSRCVKKS